MLVLTNYNLYKILFHFKDLLWESILLQLLRLHLQRLPFAILPHDHCAIYAQPPDPSFLCHAPYNIGDSNMV